MCTDVGEKINVQVNEGFQGNILFDITLTKCGLFWIAMDYIHFEVATE